jgi:hypothetical protein
MANWGASWPTKQLETIVCNLCRIRKETTQTTQSKMQNFCQLQSWSSDQLLFDKLGLALRSFSSSPKHGLEQNDLGNCTLVLVISLLPMAKLYSDLYVFFFFLLIAQHGVGLEKRHAVIGNNSSTAPSISASTSSICYNALKV